MLIHRVNNRLQYASSHILQSRAFLILQMASFNLPSSPSNAFNCHISRRPAVSKTSRAAGPIPSMLQIDAHMVISCSSIMLLLKRALDRTKFGGTSCSSEAPKGGSGQQRGGTSISLTLCRFRSTAASQRSHKTQECKSCRWQARLVGRGQRGGGGGGGRRCAARSHYSQQLFSCFLLLPRDQVEGERGRRAGWARSAARRLAV